LTLNGFTVSAGVDEQEELFLSLAAGNVSRDALSEWIESHLRPLS
jgi:prophage maintenance system killer protein